MIHLDLFSRSYVDRAPINGIVTPSDLNYLKRLYQFNKDSIESYYQDRNFSVKNTHILSRLLEHFPSYLNYDAYRYLEFSSDKTKYLAKHFKFTSEIEKGLVHQSYFFGNDGEEILISDTSIFNPTVAERNWKKACPVSVLKHSRNDLKLLLPMGNDDESRGGLDVVMVNIPMLSIKYREFVRQQLQNQTTGEGLVLGKNHFVIKYVLSSMMEDVIDHTFLNRIMDRFYGREEVTPRFKHRFKLFEPTTQVNRYVDQTLDIITGKRLDFLNIMHNIQLMFKVDASDLLALEDLGATRQVKWSLVVSRLEHMIFLYDVAKVKEASKHHINDWKRLVKRLERDNDMDGMFSYQTEKKIKEQMYTISQM
jgi:hypothetical protein